MVQGRESSVFGNSTSSWQSHLAAISQEDIEAIREWLRLHDIEVDNVSNDKPPHIVIVDDRAFRFEGDWNAVIAGIPAASIPWNKKRNDP